MNLLNWIKGVIKGMFSKEAKQEFDVDILSSTEMDQAVSLWRSIYMRTPPWVDRDDEIKTIGFGKTIATETARLATLELEITLDGSARAKYLQEEINKIKGNLRQYLEFACAFGEVILKPNGGGVDCVEAGNFIPVNTDDNGNMTGVIFFDTLTKNDVYYTRMEYHRFENEVYVISNRAYKSNSKGDIGKQIPLDSILEWKNLQDDAYISNLEKPLFSVLKMPNANGIDTTSPLGVSIFTDAIEELKDLDIAYSRNAYEIKNSKKIAFISDRLMYEPGTSIKEKRNNGLPVNIKLPGFVQTIFGDAETDDYHEIDPKINTEERLKGINQLLSFIGYKCGYSNGYFSFDQSRGLVTATQIEAEDKRTIETISDIRTSLKACIEDLLYTLDKYADLYGLAPFGVYEVSYYFKDITVSFSEDRQRYYALAMANKFPWKKYYMDYEGYSEDEADELLKMIKEENKDSGLYTDMTAE